MTQNFDRYTYVAPGRYSIDNPWGRVPKGGTQLCRFHELDDGLEVELLKALAEAVDAVDGLLLVTSSNLPWLQWSDDRTGGYWLGTGLCHMSFRSENQLGGFLWLQYRSDDQSADEPRPLDLLLTPEQARDTKFKVEHIIGALKREHQSESVSILSRLVRFIASWRR
jgi:hypothetical protein